MQIPLCLQWGEHNGKHCETTASAVRNGRFIVTKRIFVFDNARIIIKTVSALENAKIIAKNKGNHIKYKGICIHKCPSHCKNNDTCTINSYGICTSEGQNNCKNNVSAFETARIVLKQQISAVKDVRNMMKQLESL